MLEENWIPWKKICTLGCDFHFRKGNKLINKKGKNCKQNRLKVRSFVETDLSYSVKKKKCVEMQTR